MGLFCSVLGTSLITEGVRQGVISSYPFTATQAVLIMLLAGLGLGTGNGLAVSRIGMPSLIVTLAMWQITQGGAFRVSAGQSIHTLPESLSFWGQGIIAGVPVPVILFTVVAVISYFVLNHTTYGRSIYAVGGNPVSAWLTGINVKKILLSVYMISGFLAGLAAVIISGRIMSASMQTLRGLELDAIAATVIGGISLAGGRGSIIGAVIGVIIIGVINNGMSILGAGPDAQWIVKGVIIFVAVMIDFLRRR
jgi:ribose/xylose/arabinose/galactoside ABC-type transport system permease subunit